ncbi:MAG: hypothetical protein ABIZ56_01430, partial [Chthoniobacteraceae bacterium]
VVAAVVLAGALFLRPPGLDVRDGRNDRGRNGVALDRAWIAGDAAPSALVMGEFARSMREHRIAEIFVELPPPSADGTVAGIDAARIDALLYECYDARGWARIDVAHIPYDDPRWRRFFIVDLRRLLDRLPRLRGVMLDFSGVAEVFPAMLRLLDELRPALAPDARLLGIVAGKWEEPYFREVARRADQLVMPLEISSSPFSRFSVNASAERIRSTLAWCEGKPVLFCIPADKRLRRALSTIHLAFSKTTAPEQYQGIILQSPDAAAWPELRTHFLRP